MKYNEFANSGRQVSRVAFGAMGLNCAFGNFEEKQLIKAVHYSLDQGVNFIDTARTYGDSEKILSKALKQWSGESPFIASKAAPEGLESNNGWGIPNPYDIAYPKGSVRKSVEDSLQQLDIDCLDLVQLHQYWDQYQNEVWLEDMQSLKEEGKIKHIGISVTDHRHDQALAIVKSGLIDSVQTIVNIFDPIAFDSLIPLCQKEKVAVIARCVLDEGGLTGFLKQDTVFDANDFRNDYFEHGPLDDYIRRVDELQQFIPQYAKSLAELSIKYVLSHPGITCANISMHIPEYAEENIAVADQEALPNELFEKLRRHHRWLLNLYEHKYFPRSGSLSSTGFAAQ